MSMIHSSALHPNGALLAFPLFLNEMTKYSRPGYLLKNPSISVLYSSFLRLIDGARLSDSDMAVQYLALLGIHMFVILCLETSLSWLAYLLLVYLTDYLKANGQREC